MIVQLVLRNLHLQPIFWCELGFARVLTHSLSVNSGFFWGLARRIDDDQILSLRAAEMPIFCPVRIRKQSSNPSKLPIVFPVFLCFYVFAKIKTKTCWLNPNRSFQKQSVYCYMYPHQIFPSVPIRSWCVPIQFHFSIKWSFSWWKHVVYWRCSYIFPGESWKHPIFQRVF